MRPFYFIVSKENMDLKTYQNSAVVTLPNLSTHDDNITHMLFGMLTELGELTDVFKRNLAYGKDYDIVNIKEELGDIMWYWVNLCTILGFDPEEVLQVNINKLATRFADKFTQAEALNRDLVRERKVLEELGY